MNQESNNQPLTETGKPSNNYWLGAVLLILLAIISVFFIRISQNKKQPSSIIAEIDAGRANLVLPPDSAQEQETVSSENKKKEKEVTVKNKENKKNTATSSESDNYTYKVKSGDTLFKIASRFHTSAATIKTDNNMETDEVQLDQSLKIRIRAIHKVSSGEGLLAIVEKYQVKKDLIAKANNLKGDQIGLDQELVIPLP